MLEDFVLWYTNFWVFLFYQLNFKCGLNVRGRNSHGNQASAWSTSVNLLRASSWLCIWKMLHCWESHWEKNALTFRRNGILRHSPEIQGPWKQIMLITYLETETTSEEPVWRIQKALPSRLDFAFWKNISFLEELNTPRSQLNRSLILPFAFLTKNSKTQGNII